MRTLLLLLALVSLPLSASEREGHGGDPFGLEFEHRAEFVGITMRIKKMVSDAHLKAYEAALKDLRVEVTDETLLTTGRVVDDPKRPGKKLVRLDRKKYLESYIHRYGVDVNLFVAHEVFQTKELDIDHAITKGLSFSEKEFVRWYESRFGVNPPSRRRVDPICFYDVDQLIKLRVDKWGGEEPGKITVKFHDNDEVTLKSITASEEFEGVHEVVLEHKAGDGGIAGVELVSPTSIQSLYYELEFRRSPSSCNGVMIETIR